MEAQPFRSALELLAARPGAKWVAVAASLAASATPLLLAPVAYLMIDLLAHRGGEAGLAGAAARNADHWSGRPLAWAAKWMPLADDPASEFTALAAVAVLLVALRGLFLNASAYYACAAAVEVTGRLRRNMYAHAFRLGPLAVNPAMQAEAGALIADRAEQIQDGLIAWLTGGFRGPLLAAAAGLVAVAVHAWVGLASLCLLAAVWLLAGQAAAWFRRDARAAARRGEARLAVLRESLSLLRLAKSYLVDRFAQARVERQLTDLSKAAKDRLRGETLSRPTLTTAVTLAGCVVVYVAGRVILGGGMTVAGLAVLAGALAAVGHGLNRWLTARARLRRADAAAADVFEFLNRRGDAGQGVDAEFLQPMAKKLELVEVSYREPGTGRMILDGVTLAAAFGSRTAVVCPDPLEGRALADLLTRFVEPTGGEIRIDGKNVRWVTFDSLRTQVVAVLADGGTFTDTAANNIGCGDTSFGRPQVVEAAKAAHAHQFIQQLPYGYETVLGGSGVSLRPGERYRIALARALLRDPSVLVLEEPFEPFDPDSAALIDDAVAHLQGSRTVIYLARRKRTIKTADRVYTIARGRVVEGEVDESAHHRPLRAARAEARTA